MEIEIEPLTGISFRTLVFIWKSIFDEYQIFSIFNYKKASYFKPFTSFIWLIEATKYLISYKENTYKL